MSIEDFDYHIPRLGVGAGPSDGSGNLCAMQVVSWENGDKQITDYPACSNQLLAQVVQNVNDSFCKERVDALLCPDCSVKVLELAHRTVGTYMDRVPEGVYDALAQHEGVEFWWRIADLYYDGNFGWVPKGQRKTIEDAHRLIDKFEELTGIKAKPVPAEVTEQAVTKMREKVDA